MLDHKMSIFIWCVWNSCTCLKSYLGFKTTWDCDVNGSFSDKALVIFAAWSSFMLKKMFPGEERRGEERRGEERRLGLLHQQHFRRTLRSWPTSHAAWQVQRVDRWCGDGAGMVLWDDAQWPCGIARSSYGTRRVWVPTVTTVMSHWHCHFLPKWIRVSGALGQGEARTFEDSFGGCGQPFSVTRGSQLGVTQISCNKKKWDGSNQNSQK